MLHNRHNSFYNSVSIRYRYRKSNKQTVKTKPQPKVAEVNIGLLPKTRNTELSEHRSKIYSTIKRVNNDTVTNDIPSTWQQHCWDWTQDADGLHSQQQQPALGWHIQTHLHICSVFVQPRRFANKKQISLESTVINLHSITCSLGLR